MPEAIAAVVDAPHQPFHLERLTIDSPRSGEVLVRMVAVGVCATDLHARDRDLPMPLPAVLGHEGAGHVEAVGTGVTVVKPGDAVVLGWPWCGMCRNCQAGHPRYCEQFLALSMSGARSDGSTAVKQNGHPIADHFFGQSSFSTLAITTERSLVRVPDDAPLELLGPLACGIATGAGAVMNALAVPAGSSLVVFGPGSVGLSAVMAARVCGCSLIIAVGRDLRQLEQARELGATHAIDSRREDPVNAITQVAGGGADFTVDCTGNMGVARQAVDALRPLGVCALVGVSAAGSELTLDHAGLILGRRVIGINGGDGQSTQFVSRLLELHAQGRLPFDRLITTYPFDHINDAVKDLEEHKTTKAVLLMPRDGPPTESQRSVAA